MGLVDTSNIYIWGTYDIVVFKVSLGSLGALLKMTCISKRAGHRVERSDILESGVLVIHIDDNLTLHGSRSTWGHSVHLSQNG